MPKRACNFIDKNNIAKWAAEGKTAAEIGPMLNIDPKVVAKFMPQAAVPVVETPAPVEVEVVVEEVVVEKVAVEVAAEVETTAATETATETQPRKRRRKTGD
jgi:hypothetical protein